MCLSTMLHGLDLMLTVLRPGPHARSPPAVQDRHAMRPESTAKVLAKCEYYRISERVPISLA